ncbi:MAG: VWA domain-containing protein [Muribaculaceae bacterium]|nr:VWA domain-containing protein [Muribaculaceae bacterium]
MFSFAYPSLLLLLLLVPAFVCLYAWARYSRRRNLKKFGRLKVLAPLMPETSPYKPPIKITLQMLALALVIIAFARPWGGVKDEKTVKEGIEVVIAVDASNSMLASSTGDEKGIDRMRTAKLILEKLINRLDNDRVGLIVYAGDAYTLIPVTSDYVSAKMFLNSIDPSQLANQGTNITAAIDMATKSFSEDKKIGKAIILITDAEDLEDEQSVMDAAKAAARNGIQLDVVGLGSTVAVPIPIKGGGYLMNPETGEPVRTALNEDLATEIASAGKGIYVNASNNDALNELDKQLDTVKKSALESSFSAVHDELFAIFVWFALALLVADIFVLDRKIGWLDKITFFKKEEKR